MGMRKGKIFEAFTEQTVEFKSPDDLKEYIDGRTKCASLTFYRTKTGLWTTDASKVEIIFVNPNEFNEDGTENHDETCRIRMRFTYNSNTLPSDCFIDSEDKHICKYCDYSDGAGGCTFWGEASVNNTCSEWQKE